MVLWTVIPFLSPFCSATHAQWRIPKNSLLPDSALFPGGLSGKWLPAVVEMVTLGRTDAGRFPPHSMIGTFPPSRSRGVNLKADEPRSQVDALVV